MEAIDALAKMFVRLNQDCSDTVCNELLSLLKQYVRHIDKFTLRNGSMKEIRKCAEQRSTRAFSENGFRRVTFRSNSDLQYELFWKNPLVVLKQQMKYTSSSCFISSPLCSERYSHPMNADIGRRACVKAENIVKDCTDEGVYWRTQPKDGEKSCMGGLQIFSDKSQIALKAGTLSFYPLHMTLINFTEEARRCHIVERRTVVAYLPVTFQHADSDDGNALSTTTRTKKRRIGRVDFLEGLHESISFVMTPVIEAALSGLCCATSDVYRFRLHLMMTSYISDNPEAEDMLSVKRGCATDSPCHRCVVGKA